MKKTLRVFRLPSGLRNRPVSHTLLAALAVAIVALLYTVSLGRNIPLSPTELQSLAANSSLQTIINNPVNAPYKLLDFMTLQLPFGSDALRLRLASVILALLCGGLFYALARRWHGNRNALISTALFIPSSWMLHSGRFGVGLIMLSLTVLALVALASWVTNKERQGSMAVWSVIILTLAATVPAGIWFVAATVFFVRRPLKEHFAKAQRKHYVLTGGFLAIVLVGLGQALVRNVAALEQWLGWPAQMPDLVLLGKQAAGSLTYFVARGPFAPEIWLAHTPILEAGTTGLLLIGTIFYIRHRTNARVHLLASFWLIGAVLVSLHGVAAVAYLVPLAYLVAATGIAFLLHEWSTVFPRNPVARLSALGLVLILTLAVVTFHTQRYFVAWRQSPDTAQAYQSRTSDLMNSDLLQ